MGGIKFTDASNGVAVLGADQGISIDPLSKFVQLGADSIADADLGEGEVNTQRFISMTSTQVRFYPGGTFQDQYIMIDGSSDQLGNINLFGNNGLSQSPKLIFTVPGSPDTDYKIFNDGSELVIEASATQNRLIAFSQANDLITISKNVQGMGRVATGNRILLQDRTVSSGISPMEIPGTYTNRGAAGSITFTLPSVTVGGEVLYFFQVAPFEIVLQAGAGRLIRNFAVTGQTWRLNSVGSGCVLLGLGNNLWGMVPFGTWTTP